MSPSQNPIIKKPRGAGEMTQLVKCLPSIHVAQGLIASTS